MKIDLYNLNINFAGTKKNLPVYSLDSNKTLQKFETRKEAAITLGIDTSSISSVLNGEVAKAGNYTFLTPQEIENKTDSGIVQIDPIKVQMAYYKINPAIYVIEKDGKYTRYPSQIAVSKELDIAPSSVSRCINTANPKCKGYVIVSALDVEKLDEDGNTIVDELKIRDLIKTVDEEDAYYVIGKNGVFSRFSSLEETCEETGIDPEKLTKGFTGFKKVIDDKTFVRAKNLETKVVDGKNVLDEEKLINLFIGNRFAFFSIDRIGRATLFQSQAEAYGKLNASFSSITSCLTGKIKNADGYTYAKPSQVLAIDNQNRIRISKEKVDVLLSERFKK